MIKRKFLCMLFVSSLIATICCLIPITATCEQQIEQKDCGQAKKIPADVQVNSVTLREKEEKPEVNESKPTVVEAGLGDNIFVNVQNLEKLYNAAGKDRSKIILYFNNTPLKKVTAQGEDLLKDRLLFKLRLADDTRADWISILNMEGKEKELTVSVGLEQEGPVPSTGKLKFVKISKPKKIAFSVSFAVSFIAFVLIAWKTSLLRDKAYDIPWNERSYSLALTQMAWWFYIVTFSYIYIFILTGKMQAISSNAYVLFGISSLAAIGGRAVDSAKDTGKANMDYFKHKNILHDILFDTNDNRSVSLHRFQAVTWTLILGVYYIYSVIKCLTLPEFDATTLSMMGISSGTYVLLKTQEPKSSAK